MLAKTLRRRLLALPGRLTRSARQRLPHLPTDWPWAVISKPTWPARQASHSISGSLMKIESLVIKGWAGLRLLEE
jgi:hypothetical protein